MDVISHWLWGMAFTRKKVSWKVSGPMGVLPDLMAFIPASIVGLMQGRDRVHVDENTVTSDMHPIAWDIYQWSHSLFFALLIFLGVWYVLHRRGHETPRLLAWYTTIPWIAHIIVDIPSHTIQFFPTPFLHPFSDWMIDGTSWGTPWVWFTNVALLALTWGIVLWRERNQSMDEIADIEALA